jgi:simple sugar transport system permease protein
VAEGTVPSAGDEPGGTGPSALLGSLSGTANRALSRPESGAVIGTVFLFVLFSIWARPHFLSLASFASILTIAAELGIVAMGMSMLMIGGEFDLSVGSVLGISSVMIPWLYGKGVPIPAGIVIALLLGAAIGLVNGVVVNWSGIPSFIVTLGGLFWWRGVLFAVTSGFPLQVPQGSAAFKPFSARLGSGFNASLFWFLGVAAVASFVMLRTRFGNWVYATGGTPKAAQQLGIPTKRVKLVLFAVTALLAALAGVIQVGRFSSVDSLRGTGLELEVIAAAVIGGTRLTGGYGSVIGAALGCVMLGIIQTGLVLAGVPGYWYRASIGLLIVLVVIVNHKAGKVAPPR